ncbi:MAG: FtsQ-type POTRA domain-containing protein [Pseudomonadota bacterium]
MTRSRAFANQERQAQSQRLDRIVRSTLLLFATFLSFSAVTLVILDQLYRPESFVIDQLKIKGSFKYLQPQQVEHIVASNKPGNFFSIELEEIKRQIEDLAWVQQAEVRREWPDTLSVHIVEQRPVMRWNESAWVNSAGEVISLPDEVTFKRPVQLTGSERNAQLMLHQAKAWKQRLAARDIQLIGLRLSESHAWHLQLRHQGNEFALLLGREQIEQRLQRFEMLFEQQFRRSPRQLHRVDARYPDGLAIEASPLEEVDAESLAVERSTLEETNVLVAGSVADRKRILDSLTGNQ